MHCVDGVTSQRCLFILLDTRALFEIVMENDELNKSNEMKMRFCVEFKSNFI